MGTAQCIFAGTVRGDTESDVSNVTGSDIRHRNRKYVMCPSEAF